MIAHYVSTYPRHVCEAVTQSEAITSVMIPHIESRNILRSTTEGVRTKGLVCCCGQARTCLIGVVILSSFCAWACTANVAVNDLDTEAIGTG